MKSRSKPTCFVPAYSPPKLGGEPEAWPYFLRLRAIALALRAGSRFAVREASPPNLGGELRYCYYRLVLSTTTRPAFITQRIFSLLETAVILTSGSPSTATRSA